RVIIDVTRYQTLYTPIPSLLAVARGFFGVATQGRLFICCRCDVVANV
ncbi:hypothetical protein HMPREF9281_02419, partial [Staphylococcus epidermidis BVS058A4]